MAVRIRVYPQNGIMGGMGGYGMNRSGAVSAQTYFNSKLTSQKQVSNLQLGYERALADERINNARLEERLKNPYAMLGQGGFNGGFGAGYQPMSMGYNPWASTMLGSSMLGSSRFFGSLGLGGMF
jgi:hypothetical protein